MVGQEDTNLSFQPRSFERGQIDFDNDIEFDTDSDFYDSDVDGKITLFTAPLIGNRGEIWEIYTQVTLSSEPDDDIVLLRYEDGNSNVIARSALEDFGGNSFSLKATVESDQIGGDLDVTLSAVNANDDFNYFAVTRAFKLRKESDTSTRKLTVNDSAATFDGQL